MDGAQEKLSDRQRDKPRLAAGARCTVRSDGGRMLVEVPGGDFAVTRSAILRYFDGELIEFVEIK